MTPKEKAKDIVEKFYLNQCQILGKYGTPPFNEVEYKIAKQCAIIAVDELINSGVNVPINSDDIYGFGTSNYWQQVKTEIEKL